MRSAVLSLVVWLCSAVIAADLPRSSPEAQGVSSEALRWYVEAADREIHTMHSFMLLRHGQVVAEGWWKPEAADKNHVMWSTSKSFTSTAVGLAIAEGKFGLDDPVLKFFPDAASFLPADAPEAAKENLKALKVRDLLSMASGHEKEPKFKIDTISLKDFFSQPITKKPGTHFYYNTPATYVCSAIVTKTTGQTVFEYLKPRLFEPLGFVNPTWGTSAEGNTFGGYGLFIRTEDLAKFGQLLLQKGMWNGKQLVPADWIAQATAKQVDNDQAPSGKNKVDWRQGYGFQFWRCTHNAFRGDGKDGQFIIVLPEQDAVIAITALTSDMQKEIDVIWDKLLPALFERPLCENPKENAKLKKVLANLVAHPKPVAAKPPAPAPVPTPAPAPKQ